LGRIAAEVPIELFCSQTATATRRLPAGASARSARTMSDRFAADIPVDGNEMGRPSIVAAVSLLPCELATPASRRWRWAAAGTCSRINSSPFSICAFNLFSFVVRG
jgi:hypothetical protein